MAYGSSRRFTARAVAPVSRAVRASTGRARRLGSMAGIGGTRRGDGRQELMSESTDRDLLERGVGIARDGFASIVVGFDGSPTSRSALVFAGGLAARGDAELVVVLVGAANPIWALSPGATAADAELDAGLAEVLQADTANQLSDLDVRWRFEHREGDAAEELLATGRETSADLIVVGRASDRLARRLVGSVAATLTREADRPVLVVP